MDKGGGWLRERIIETASQLIGRHGLRRFTLVDLATQLGISKKSIYKYFLGKNEIISVFFDEVLESDRTSTLQEMDKMADAGYRGTTNGIFNSIQSGKTESQGGR